MASNSHVSLSSLDLQCSLHVPILPHKEQDHQRRKLQHDQRDSTDEEEEHEGQRELHCNSSLM